MIKYLHIDYLRTHPLNPNQPETHFLRLPHQLIFTLVLAGNFLAAVSFHTQAPFLLSTPTPALPCIHPASPVPGVAVTFHGECSHRRFNQKEGHSVRKVRLMERARKFAPASAGPLYASIHMPPQFVLGYVEFYWKSYTDFIHDHTHRLEWQIFYFLCSTQRANVTCRAETLLIGVVWLLVFFWS